MSFKSTTQFALGADSLPVLNTNALDAFWAGLADCANNPCDIMPIGDSRTEGQGTVVVTDRAIDRLLALLRAVYQPATIVGGRGYIPAWYAFASPVGQGPTVAGTPTQSTTYGLGRRSYLLNVLADALTWPTVTCTSADLIYNNQLTGTLLSGNFDADAATNITTTSSGGPRSTRITPTAGRGLRILHANWRAGSPASANIEGAMFYDGDEAAGIRLLESAHYGFTIANLVSSLGGNENWLSTVGNLFSTSIKLVPISFGTNESTSVTSAVFGANLSALIARIRTRLPTSGTTIAIIMQPARTATGTPPVEPWSNYVAAAKGIALADTSVFFLDISQRIPTADADVLGRFNADKIHETRKGYQQEANLMFRALAPR